MVDALLWAAIGVVIGALGAYGWARRKRSGTAAKYPAGALNSAAVESEATPEPLAESAPPAAPPPPPPASLAARLQAVTSDLDNAVKSSAYPTDLVDNAAFQKALALLREPTVSIETLLQYALGANTGLSCVAFEALALHADVRSAYRRIASGFADIGMWQLHFALRAILAADPTAPIGAALLYGADSWRVNPVAFAMVAEYLRAARARSGPVDFGEGLAKAGAYDIEVIGMLLQGVDDPLARELKAALDTWRKRSIDRAALAEFGQFVEPGGPADALLELPPWSEPLTLCEAALTAKAPRSVVIVGEPRFGKSSLVRLVARRLQRNGYAVFSASAAEIMAGKKYIGEVEERVRLLLRELAVTKRVVWHVPDLAQLAVAGLHGGQSASILDQVMPAIAAGEIVLISETTPAQLTRLLQRRPALHGILQLVRLHPLSATEIESATSAFAAKLQEAVPLEIAPDVVGVALHIARQYLGAPQAVGAVFDFIKLACTRALGKDRSVLSRDDLLETLSQATGLPRAILDDGEKVELTSLRSFFTERVIGQAAAVDAIVDRIAMLKAGLTDPARPIGVFLFAGPTGTGKTELAKTLAEYLFGTPDRMIRLDMSEYQVPASVRKIVGDPEPGEGESLTQKVRKQPFCVVLLDEFEKAHPNTWDLFLQVFDDGRLTDESGHAVDFRHAFFVLTTNLGATAHKGGNVGFAPNSTAFTDTQVLRVVHQSFKPEFVNRIDRVIVFQPLSRERMQEILQRELKRVLERRGLKEREWAVEWESSAREFLLDKGFTPDMGARPLRRAIDQYLLAPLAATLVEHRFPQGEQFLFVRSDGRAIQVEFVDPDADTEAHLTPGPASAEELGGDSLGQIILHPTGLAAERALLRARVGAAKQTLHGPELEAVRARLAGAMHDAAFWERDDRFTTLARYALLDRVRAALDTANSLEDRLVRSGRSGAHSKTIAARLAQQLYLVELGLADAREGCVADAVLSVAPALEAGGDRAESEAWCARLHRMYRGWAARRHMHFAEFTSHGRPALVIVGFGAWRVLSAEAGLHVLEGDGGQSYRRAARVVVAADEPANPAFFARREQRLAALLAAAPSSSDVVRRYREGAAPLVRDARAGWRTGRLDLVLTGDFDLLTT